MVTMTLSYFESILHLVENASPDQLEPSYLKLLQKYGDHLIESCHFVGPNIPTQDNKNILHDYLRIANSILRTKNAIEKCKGAYEKTVFTGVSITTSSGPCELDDLPEELKSFVSEAISDVSNLFDDKSKIEGPGCEECLPKILDVLHPYIEKLEDDEQGKEIKILENELRTKLELKSPKPKGQRIEIE